MGTTSIIQRQFTGGELSPAMGARADIVKYTAGLSLCRNFIVQRHGGVANRPGTRFVAEVKTSSDPARLLPFIFEAADQTYVIEAGHGYFRFFWHGAPVIVSAVTAWSGATAYVVGDLVVSGGVNYYCILAHTNHVPPNATYWYALTGTIYEIPTPYAAADVARLNVVQSADILTITHPSYVPMNLERFGATNWVLAPFTTAPSIAAPTSPAGTAGAVGTQTFRYVVTAAKIDTYEESYPSTVIVIGSCAVPTIAAPNTLTWDVNAGATEYYVYADPYNNGIFGFVGAASTNSFADPGFVPDFTLTPPTPRVLFNATGDYPSVAAYYQQRLVFANSLNNRETVWASKVGAYHNFSISTPLQDDDAVTFVLASNEVNPVAHLMGLRQELLILSDGGEWAIRGNQAGVLTPSGINASQEGYIGASAAVRPVVVASALLYVQVLGTVLREMVYDLYQASFASTDLSVFADHLFAGFTLADLAYAKQPNSVLWAVRSDGTLLGLTYLRDQEIAGWHQHTTGATGVFEGVVSVPDSTAAEDVVYLLVRRTIGGVTKRYVERFASRQITTLAADAFFVDSGLSYSGAPATVFSGLDHLEGQIVAVLGDGVVVFDGDPTSDSAATFTVTGGAVTLPAARSVVHIGLPIRFAEIETLDLDIQGSAIRDKKKRVQDLTVLIDAGAQSFLAGPDADHLLLARREAWMPAATVDSGPLEVNLTANFRASGRVRIRHTDPLPLTILGVIPNLEVSAA